MTNKSIGNFLAELRKEKGLTQKDVADFLNVSDKTVSHWECDKYSPDISAIPILAEFFGVTCDDILKGERKAVETEENASGEYYNKIESDCSENNFSYEPLTKESEHTRYARIRLHNVFSKMKLTNVIAIFIAIVLWAVSYTIIQLIEHKIGIHNFELYATIGSAFFSATVGAIIIVSSHLKFISMVNMCPFEEVEFLKWRRKAKSIIIVPLAILMLICIIASFAFAPLAYMDISQSETMVVPGYLEEEEGYNVIISNQSEDISQEEGYYETAPTSMTTDSGATQYADTSEEVSIFD